MKKDNRGNGFLALFGGIFALVGLGLLIGGIIWFTSTKKFISNADVVSATITEIDTYRDSDGDYHHSVFVAYEYNGRNYDVYLPEYSSSMYEGKKISVYVDPDNPGKVRGKSMAYLGPIMLMGMGGVFSAIGLPIFFVGIKKQGKKKRLLAEGERRYATIVGSGRTNVKINGRYLHYVDCEYQDPYSGMKYLYRGGQLREDPYHLMGVQVPVYVDRNDPSQYYVAAEEINTMDSMVQDYR